jgi:hydroxyacylglutathione hydrolase
MHEVAPDLWQIPLLPRHCVNAYLIGDVIVDAGAKGMGKKVVDAVSAHETRAHAITHAHGDHIGGSKHVLETLGLPFWVPANDAAAVEAGRQVVAESRFKPLVSLGAKFDALPIDRRLQEGDELAAGFTVLDTPGHSPGHVSFWRESDRVLVCADVFFNFNMLTLQYGLRQPPNAFTVDPELNRASERKLAELEPAVVCFGHGPPLRDPAALKAFVAAL